MSSRSLLLALALAAAAASDPLTVFFIDPGYSDYSGDAMLVRTPSGGSYLIDGGDHGSDPFWDCGESRVLPLLDSLGITHLDGIVATHPHSDHIGGLISVLETVTVDSVWDSGFDSGSFVYGEFMDAVEACGSGLRILRRGDSLDWGPDLSVQVLHPVDPLDPGNINNASIVLRLSYLDVSFLFTGDLETEGGEEVVLDALALGLIDSIASDVLKVGHHGSYTSTSTQWLAAVSPDWAAIEVGAGNPFGHPHGEVIARLLGRDIDIFRTDLLGTFFISTDGDSLYFQSLPGGGAPGDPSGFVAYPSPCSDHVTFRWPESGGSQAYTLRVVNLSGETVMNRETGTLSVEWDLSLDGGSLASPGLYAAVLEDGGGGRWVEYFSIVR